MLQDKNSVAFNIFFSRLLAEKKICHLYSATLYIEFVQVDFILDFTYHKYISKRKGFFFLIYRTLKNSFFFVCKIPRTG